MFKFLRAGRDKQAPDGAPVTESPPSRPFPAASTSLQQQLTTTRQLARVVLRDILHMNAIPTDWISCESTPLASDRSDGSLLIQLVINRWHEGLATYAPLLQQQFQHELQRTDGGATHSQHVVVWRFSPFCGYPGTTMPAADFWLPKPAFTAKRKFDLPPSDLDQLGDDFAPTVPGEFR